MGSDNSKRVAQAKKEAKKAENEHVDNRIESIIRQMVAMGCKITDRHSHHSVKTLEMPSGVFEQTIHRGNMSIYFTPANSQVELADNIEGYLEFRTSRYAIWIDPATMVGTQSVLGLNKTSL